jgi:CubicO group peptidase (beta-lactamase class C family)
MKALGFVLAALLTVVGPHAAGAAERGAEEVAQLVPFEEIFVPGPPIWQPPELRPKAIGADTLEEAVDRCVGDAMDLAHTPGAAAAVIIDGEMAYEQGYGVKRRSGSDPVDAETQFRIGSVTKMLTAAAVMQQVDAGAISLDDSLSLYVPEAEFLRHFSTEAITIHRLMTHATGIPDLQFQANGDTRPGALSDWAETLSTIGLHAPPGAFWNYSNPNFNLAGLVVERASGTEFRSYMDTHVFGPAGMTSTTFDPAAVMARGNASHGHFDDGSGAGPVYAPDSYDNHVYAPAGYAFSTAGDIARWVMLLADGGGDVLSPESAAAMQRSQQSMETLPGFGYGYGVFVEPFYDLEIRQHGGNIWGWGAFVLWHPERRFAVAVLANTFESLSGAAYCVADYVLEPNHDAAPVYPPPDPEHWRLFEGTFDASVGSSQSFIPYPITGAVSVDSHGRLSVHFWDPAGSWSQLWDLEHVGYDYFVTDIDYDGDYDLDVSFLTGPGSPERTRWLRMRQIVGYPQVDPRHGHR